MSRARILVTAAVALVAAAGLSVGALAHPGAVVPGPKQMALTIGDLGKGAVVESQRFTTQGPIDASRGYQRSFTGVTLGKAHLFTIQHTVLVGKTPSAAARLISSILLASSSKSGRDALYGSALSSFASSSKLTVTKGAITRVGELKAGDAAVEIVFRFDTPTGSFQVGEIFVRVGGTLGTVYYGAGTPGVSLASARHLAVVAAAHMAEAGRTG